MTLVKLPIHEGMAKATDEVGLTNLNAELINVFVDDLLNVNRWPGYEEFAATGEAAGIDGMFWWENQSRVIVVCNQKTFQITDANGTIAEITGDTFEAGNRVKFADFGSALYAANRGKINAISTSAVTQMADADAPTSVSHTAVISRYLIGNELSSGNFHWADVNAPTSWSGYYAEAEANPDNLVALDVQNKEVALLGKKTLEFFTTDESSPFISLYQGTVQAGTVAPYSFVWCDAVNSYVWLDQKRRVVRLDGRQAVPISITVNKYIQEELSTVSDAIGDYAEISGRPFYIITFPVAGKTLAYDFFSERWYTLGSWNTGTASYDRYRANCWCLAPDWNYTLIGDYANGKIYKISTSIYDENGSILRSLLRTAHYNHGTERLRKTSNGIYVRLKRTSSVSDDETPDLMVRYRDDGNTTWNSDFSLPLHAVSNTEFVAHATRLGSYFSRQWEFYMTDSYPLCLVSVEEDVEIESA